MIRWRHMRSDSASFQTQSWHAALAILAGDGDDVVSSDVEHFEMLAAHLGRHAEILHV
jgi:hypothetical protein